RPIAFFPHRARNSRIVRIRESLVANGETTPALPIRAPPFVCVAGVEADAAKKVLIVHVSAMISEVHRAGHTRNGESFLHLVTEARRAAEIPSVHVRVIFAQPFIEETLEGTRGWRRSVLARSHGDRGKEKGFGKEGFLCSIHVLGELRAIDGSRSSSRRLKPG